MFLTRRFYIAITAVIIIMIAAYFLSPLFVAGKVLWWLLVAAVVIDFAALFHRRAITASRQMSDRFSCGDDNEVRIHLLNAYPFPVSTTTIDEVPHIFQRRDIRFLLPLRAGEGKTIVYRLCPKSRGVYGFGRIRVFARSPLGLLERRFTLGEPADVKVYPSYLMLRQYQILAMSNNLTELGIKRIRRAGNNTDFEQIREYVTGDDYRTINWKATARRLSLMVNVYQEEKSQQVINIIDKGRVMQQAFDGMTLLDRAINASLILSYVSINKEDKAGIITFEKDFDTFVAPDKGPKQMPLILESLYAQTTTYGESDYSALLVNMSRLVTRRSLIVLYTNFLNHAALMRQLPYLTQLNKRHRLLVVFFDDKQLQQFAAEKPKRVSDYYSHVIAAKVDNEKRHIVSTLMQHGIYALLTPPEGLTVNVVNRYLEMKARSLF